MHPDMRFCNGDDTSDSYGLELMEGMADYCGAGVCNRAHKYLAHTVQIIQQFCVTLIQFKKQVSA